MLACADAALLDNAAMCNVQHSAVECRAQMVSGAKCCVCASHETNVGAGGTPGHGAADPSAVLCSAVPSACAEFGVGLLPVHSCGLHVSQPTQCTVVQTAAVDACVRQCWYVRGTCMDVLVMQLPRPCMPCLYPWPGALLCNAAEGCLLCNMTVQRLCEHAD